jgi:hypothetical protein
MLEDPPSVDECGFDTLGLPELNIQWKQALVHDLNVGVKREVVQRFSGLCVRNVPDCHWRAVADPNGTRIEQ